MPRALDKQLEKRDKCHLKPWLLAENTLGEASSVDWPGGRETCRTGSVASSDLLSIHSQCTAWNRSFLMVAGSPPCSLCFVFSLVFLFAGFVFRMKGKSPKELVKSCSNADDCFLLYVSRLIPVQCLKSCSLDVLQVARTT